MNEMHKYRWLSVRHKARSVTKKCINLHTNETEFVCCSIKPC